jgi:heme o synthase
VFVWYAYKVFQIREGREADTAARTLFGFSILYLFALFLVLLAEHTIRIVMGG